ncbi:hypothetical protein EYR40_003863 [Pleurotus pulmonarius]|nr:hypothetical protein EYR40_003863 [Pleurotus pulmonarius]KAF4606571.1 hypothetical protein EYR38_000625 [Pleurotus pulmonarius]
MSSATHPLLAKYLAQLAAHPLRTKAITTGSLCFLQEVIGSNIAKTPIQRPPKGASTLAYLLAQSHIDAKALKMAIYGFFVSAPLAHYLVGLLQKAFAGKTSTKAKIGQIVANNLLIAPITTSSYLASMAIIAGARSFEEVVATVKAGFFSVIRISWVVSPISLLIAQKFIPIELWVPFFNSIQFILGTIFNVKTKRVQMAKAKAKRDAEEKAARDEKDT